MAVEIDIELGHGPAPALPTAVVNPQLPNSVEKSGSSRPSHISCSASPLEAPTIAQSLPGLEVENEPSENRRARFRNGYPQLAKLLSAHDDFLIVRRFVRLRSRLLLYSQDNLAKLEDDLDLIDDNEPNELYLGQHRRDENPERHRVLREIKNELDVYDDLVKRTQEVSAYEKPPAWSLHTYRTWLGNEKCIEETECEFIDDTDDLAYLGRLDDVVTSWLDYTLCRILPRKSKLNVSTNEYMTIVDRGIMDKITRFIIAPLVAMLLLVPLIICQFLTSPTARFITIIVSAFSFVILLAVLTKIKTTDLAIAAATYTAVLMVFVSPS